MRAEGRGNEQRDLRVEADDIPPTLLPVAYDHLFGEQVLLDLPIALRTAESGFDGSLATLSVIPVTDFFDLDRDQPVARGRIWPVPLGVARCEVPHHIQPLCNPTES